MCASFFAFASVNMKITTVISTKNTTVDQGRAEAVVIATCKGWRRNMSQQPGTLSRCAWIGSPKPAAGCPGWF